MEIYPFIAILFFLFTLQKYVQFFFLLLLFGFAFMNYLYSTFLFSSQALSINYLRIIKFCISSYNKGFIFFYFQVVFELCLYVHYQIKLIFLNSTIFMLLFLIFIFVVSNIICVRYKNVIIRQPISQKRIVFIFLANEIPLVKFSQVFNY